MLEVLKIDDTLKVLEVIETLGAVTASVALETSIRVFEVVEVSLLGSLTAILVVGIKAYIHLAKIFVAIRTSTIS